MQQILVLPEFSQHPLNFIHCHFPKSIRYMRAALLGYYSRGLWSFLFKTVAHRASKRCSQLWFGISPTSFWFQHTLTEPNNGKTQSANVGAGMWKKNLVVTAAVSCDHYKGGKLHRNRVKKSPLVLIKCFLCIYLSLTSWQLPVAIACTFLPTLFVLLEKGVQSWFISRISRLALWQVPFFLYFIVQLNSYQMSWVQLKK